MKIPRLTWRRSDSHAQPRDFSSIGPTVHTFSGECVDFMESMTLVHIGPGKFIWPFWRRIYHFEQCGRRPRTWRRGAKHSDQAQVTAAPSEWWVLRLTISERSPSAKIRRFTYS